MPFIFNKDGVYYRPIEILTTRQGVSKNVQSLQVSKGGVLTEVWKHADAQRMLILSNEITYDDNPDRDPDAYLTFEFPESGIWRVVVIGDGANGGASGKTWGAYSAGQGGGGGTGGCVVLRTDLSDGVNLYLRLHRTNEWYNVGFPEITVNSINCEFISYNKDIKYHGFWITPGYIGSKGRDADPVTWNPTGGAGGQGGKVFYYTKRGTSDTLTELTDCIGYNGVRGAEGMDAGPPLDTSLGHGAEAPPNINEYNALSSPPQKIQYIPNVYQRPDDYYVAMINTSQDACAGYTLDHLALGNAGAGGWDTIVDGDFPPGQGALGGVVIEKLT